MNLHLKPQGSGLFELTKDKIISCRCFHLTFRKIPWDSKI